MPRILFALLCLSCLSPAPALAAVHWLCGLSEDLTRIVCVADADSAEEMPVATRTAVVNGVQFPLDPRRSYTVELWSPATDAAYAGLLARSTICYRSPGCEVTFSAPALEPQPVLYRAARTR
jgi:hypothetical protein